MASVRDHDFLPYETGRVVLRRFEPDDVPVLSAYRSDPDVARYQDWAVPFGADAAAKLVAAQADLTGPARGRWIQVGIEHTGELVGDVAIRLDDSGALATLGYTLRINHQGLGLGVEAVGAAVDRLFVLTGVHRVAATLDPENAPSARLLERLGFRYEGRAVAVAAVRGEWLDDDMYALLAADRAAWLARPTSAPSDVRLVEVDAHNLPRLTAVAVHHSQQRFVPSVRDALVEVLVPPVISGVALSLRVHGIEADGQVVGVVGLSSPTAAEPGVRLRWLLVDRWHQRRGIGAAAARLAADLARAGGHATLRARWPVARGGPAPFFAATGFVVTSVTGDAIEGELDLAGCGRRDSNPHALAGTGT